MYKECRHILPDGAKCKASALKDMPYCYYHDRLHRSGSRQKSLPKGGIELQPLEDRSSIQLALSRVICALADGRIDPSRARQLLYGFQVAAQFSPRYPISLASEPVESLTRSSDGQELAPDTIKCFDGDECETCPYREDCPDPDEEDEDGDGEGEGEGKGDDDQSSPTGN